MSKVRKVFVGIDFSEGSDEALRQAHARALSVGATLAVCHIVPNELRSNLFFPQISGIALEGIPADLQKAGDAVAAHVTEVTGRSAADFDLIVDDGTPHAAILIHAEEWLADLIVVGSHGASSTHLQLGSVANQIIRHAHCPVLIARPAQGGAGIIAGTDFSDPALPALRAAADEVRRTGEELTLVHCLDMAWSVVTYPAMAFGGTPITLSAEQLLELEKAAEERLTSGLEQLGVRGKTRVLRGSASAALIELATQQKASLVVVGTVGRTGLRRALLGSVAEAVAREAPCSVLVVRLHPS